MLWAVLVGALFKYVLTEGIARFQLATGKSILVGAVERFGRLPLAIFLLGYVVPFGWVVGSALVTACGVAAQSLLPLPLEPDRAILVHAVVHSAIGLALARFSNFRVFERTMSACVLVMFVTVLALAVRLAPPVPELLRGLLVPLVPEASSGGTSWTLALIGGVGGTLTILCYGDWIREHGRTGPAELRTCRIDLAVGYAVTAVFGLAMVVLGSAVAAEGTGARMLARLTERVTAELGPLAGHAFAVGAWAAIFSSLLGVWQAVPRLFAELTYELVPGRRGAPAANLERTPAYVAYQVGLAVLPIAGLAIRGGEFRLVQKTYALTGAVFLPLLAAALLVLNGSRERGAARNGPWTLLALLATLGFFVIAAWIGAT